MNNLNNLTPDNVFYYFKEICQIPHGSGNTKAISDYCADVAKKAGLRYVQDDSNNIIIYKNGTEGYENSPAVILQGHLDMVCEKESDCTIDMDKEGLNLAIDGDYIYAKKTTLGGDDGVAVAFMLAILTSDNISHPPIEAVFTVDEEIGMLGAASIDMSNISGRIMLNLDSEVEGEFLTSCAGGIRVDCITPLKKVTDAGVCYEIKIGGLNGGHSGVEIDKWSANSNILAGRLLLALDNQAEFLLSDIHGGLKDNAIPVETSIKIFVNNEDCKAVDKTIKHIEDEIKKEYASTDPDLYITFKKGKEGVSLMYDESSTKKVIFLLMNYPNGIQRMSSNIEGLVETSLNLGILYIKDNKMHASFSLRSSISSAKEAITDKLVFLTEYTGGTCNFSGDYPAWEYLPDSKLRTIIDETYTELFDKKCKMSAIHAGVECGIFSEGLKGLDCVSYGPEILDIHTTRERLSISSVKRVYDFTLEILKRLK